jgi:hypothetical protein
VQDLTYNLDAGQWVVEEAETDISDDEWLLTATGWVTIDDSIASVTYNSDGSITFNCRQ